MARIGSLNILSEGLTQEDFNAQLNAKLGAQTPFGFAIGDGPNNPLLWTQPLGPGQIMVGTTSFTLPFPTSIHGAGGISINRSLGSITISGSGTGFSWSVVGGMVVPMDPDHGYIAIGPADFTLPLAAAVGQTVIVVGNGANWKIEGGTMNILESSGTTLSTLSSGTGFDAVTLVCVVFPNTYVATSTMGNIEIS